jgi:hypothetical protein
MPHFPAHVIAGVALLAVTLGFQGSIAESAENAEKGITQRFAEGQR